jgi:hypothetical protein
MRVIELLQRNFNVEVHVSQRMLFDQIPDNQREFFLVFTPL